jgi:hypothetical protein
VVVGGDYYKDKKKEDGNEKNRVKKKNSSLIKVAEQDEPELILYYSYFGYYLPFSLFPYKLLLLRPRLLYLLLSLLL